MYTARNASGLLQSIPRLGKPLRLHASQAKQSFHAAPIQQYPLLEVCCGQISELINALHTTTGLPWAATLPLTAILVRTVVVLPLTIVSQRHRDKLVAISPILHAWRAVLQKRVMNKHSHLGPAKAGKLLLHDMRIKTKEMYNTFGLKRWPQYVPLLQLPVWLLVIETIRKMCGTREGLLGLIASSLSPTPPEGVSDTDTSGDAANTAMEGASTATISEIPAIVDAPNMALEGGSAASSQVPVVQSLSTEGALWFPDLLAPDPQLYLPYILAATLWANVTIMKKLMTVDGFKETRFRKYGTRTLQFVTLGIGPATVDVPSAILIYWISSSVAAFTQAILLRKFMPLAASVQPCKPKIKSHLEVS